MTIPPFEISINVQASMQNIWLAWTQEHQVSKWFIGSPDWFVPNVQMELGQDLEFTILMAAKDGSVKFPFKGTFTKIVDSQFIQYYTEDGRKVDTYFIENDESITIHQEIEAEASNPYETQKQGWLTILNNFKTYVEEL